MLPPTNLSTAGQPIRSGRETFSSLALSNLVEPLKREGKHHVLDLGPACGPTVAFFTGFRCKVYVADLLDALGPKPTAAGETGRAPPLVDQRPLIEDGTHLDIILAWDVLNYLQPNILLALFGQLRPFCRRGTLMHALIWGHSEIPAEPMAFRITDQRHVTYELSSTATKSGPRYAPREMERLMAGFRVTRSYLLRNGMQEFVFSLDDPESAP